MVMDMLDMSVTLIVKAPNQQIEDQTIKCEPTWTIKKLKGYLSEVYPSKPRTEDQKLIYSGQLLPDSVILRDILRWYEGQEAHTLHLVCAPPRDRRPVNRSQSRMSEKKNTSALGENGVNSGTGGTDAADGLRQRLSSAEVPTSHSFTGNGSSGQFRAPDPGTTWAAAMAQPYGAGYDPNSMVQQLAMMQQAYAHYMAQYMQMLASGAGMPSGLNAQSLHPPQVTVPSPAVPEQVAPPVENQVQEAEAAVENNGNILDQLLEEFAVERKPTKGGRPPSGGDCLRLSGRHFPKPVPPTQSKQKPQRRCFVCQHTKKRPPKRTDTKWMCVECDRPLCVHPCFEEYHTLKTF